MLTEWQQTLWSDLSRLTSENEAFYFTDFDDLGTTLRIFNYRLASYTDFLQPSAMECRGHMFEIDEDENPIRLASLPMEKFFNLHEMSPDINTLAEALIKQGRLSRDVFERAKTKGEKAFVEQNSNKHKSVDI